MRYLLISMLLIFSSNLTAVVHRPTHLKKLEQLEAKDHKQHDKKWDAFQRALHPLRHLKTDPL